MDRTSNKIPGYAYEFSVTEMVAYITPSRAWYQLHSWLVGC